MNKPWVTGGRGYRTKEEAKRVALTARMDDPYAFVRLTDLRDPEEVLVLAPDSGEANRARQIAAEWHGGQGSALYAFASSGWVQLGIHQEVSRERRTAECKELEWLAHWLGSLTGE